MDADCSQDQEEAMDVAAGKAIVTSANSDNLAQVYRSEEITQELLALGKRLNQVVETRGVARVIANSAATLLNWDFFSLHLYDSANVQLNLDVAMERSPEKCKLFPSAGNAILMPAGLLQDVLTGSAISLNSDEVSPADRQNLLPFGSSLPLMSSIILSPIRGEDRIIGLICLQSKTVGLYGPNDAATAADLSEYCSGALDRVWTQQVLKEHSDNYRLLVENINDSIVISQDDRFVFFNRRFASLLEYDYEELQRMTYKDIYTEKGLEILYARAALREAGETVPDEYETLFSTKSGRIVSVEANVTIIQDYKGQLATFAVIRDNTERKKAEEKLRTSEQQFRTLFNAMTDLILVLDRNGTYLNHGLGGQQQLTLPWEQIVGKTVFDIYPPDKAEFFIKNIRRALQDRETVNIEYEVSTQSGDNSWFNASISLLSETSVLWVARDLTESRDAAEELFRSNARYEALLDGSEDIIFVLDPDLRFSHINANIEKRYGIRREDRLGRTMWEIFDEPRPAFIKTIQNVFLTGKPASYDFVYPETHICTETVISPVFSQSGEVEAVMGIARDVTEQRKSGSALKKSEGRYAAAVRGANDGIWDWDLETNLLYLSPRWWEIVGEVEANSNGNCLPEVWFDRVHVEDKVRLQEKINDHLHNRSPHLEDEHRIRHADGSYCWVLCRGISLRDDDGRIIQMAGSMSDITARKDAEGKLQYGARHDALTGLPNRSYFLHCLEKAMARARRRSSHPCQFAVLFLDLDRFKIINDSLGHLAGDELLIAAARRLEKCVRPGDTVARMGGDEFTILLEDLNNSGDVTRVASRIIEELHAPIHVSGFPVQVTVSVGIAFDKLDYTKPDDLLRDSDTAMYRAKEKGRNCYQVFDQQMHNSVMGQLKSEGDLRRAVARQEFALYYQPVYALPDCRLSGFESLIRWNHPERGLVHPADFINLAEETGLIIPLGWWVIDQAARASAQWNENRSVEDRLNISINISPKQFSQANVLKHVLHLISKAGALPGDVILEITETLLMDDSVTVSELLQELRGAGIRLDLDDFGTGYSSLSFLRRSPLDMIKIDQSFVKDLGDCGKSRELVKAILALAKGLGLQVTAEGVETKKQFDALVEMGCDWAQGHFFHQPLQFEETLLIPRQFDLQAKLAE